ncbi:MAG TPA: Ldh family oxidoreductase, partial [Chloroflexota bacterium]|nr:Ldh family oxidoreductase [Chloroflexota bacterium]
SGHSAPFGGAARHLGTNPWAVGVPGKTAKPVVVDFATTVVAEGKLQVARAKHAPLPPGCIVDKEGKPSTNAEDFYAGGMILPVGGHKGYGLSLVAAMIGAGLTAERAGTDGRGGGVFLTVIDPHAFAGEDAYTGTIDDMAAAVKAVPAAPGFSEVLLPGEPEERSREDRRQNGVPVPEDTWKALQETAEKLGVPVPRVN